MSITPPLYTPNNNKQHNPLIVSIASFPHTPLFRSLSATWLNPNPCYLQLLQTPQLSWHRSLFEHKCMNHHPFDTSFQHSFCSHVSCVRDVKAEMPVVVLCPNSKHPLLISSVSEEKHFWSLGVWEEICDMWWIGKSFPSVMLVIVFLVGVHVSVDFCCVLRYESFQIFFATGARYTCLKEG